MEEMNRSEVVEPEIEEEEKLTSKVTKPTKITEEGRYLILYYYTLTTFTLVSFFVRYYSWTWRFIPA